MQNQLFFLFLIVIVSFLYASVGHGGASGYLALMVLFGINQSEMKTSALILNVFVSAIAFISYYREGYFRSKILIPFIILSIPLAFIGAHITIDTRTYKLLLAACLLIATMRILGFIQKKNSEQRITLRFIPAMLIGGVIGLISGILGIGGGVILSPVLLLLHWANMKETAALSAAFIFLNSIAGLAGATLSDFIISPTLYFWSGAAIIGGMAGAYFGSKRFNPTALKYVLSVVMVFAIFKLIIS